MFPVVTVSSSPTERGRQYGEQARDGIHRTIDSYAQVYAHYAGWDWQRSRAEAERFLPAIEALSPTYMDELVGLAQGAGVEPDDVLAINVRTEILYSARVRTAQSGAPPVPPPDECSAFAFVGAGHLVAGQNWDWMPFAQDSLVVLHAAPDDGPAYVTVVEAGLLAKFGVNSSGLAVMTNALACADDVGEAGVPYHVMLRALLACHSTEEALDCISSARRASSANYLLADRSGHAVDVEARPGGSRATHRIDPDPAGVVLHTNHFVSPDFDTTDYADMVPTTSRTRLGRAREMAAERTGGQPLGAGRFFELLTDHTHAPDSICRHPDPSMHPLEQSMTVASMVVDLGADSIMLASGPPCTSHFEPVHFPQVVTVTT